MSYKEIDGVYYVDNPADTLLDKSLVDDAVDYFQDYSSGRAKEIVKSVEGQKYETGFEISREMASSIIKYYAPKRTDIEAASYTLTTVGAVTMLLARDEKNVVVFSIELPTDVMDTVKEAEDKEHLEYLMQRIKKTESCILRGNIIITAVLIVILLAYLGLLYVTYKMAIFNPGGMVKYGPSAVFSIVFCLLVICAIWK